MKILCFGSHSYDENSFKEHLASFPDLQVSFIESDLTPTTAGLASGYDAVCGFVNSNISQMTLEILAGLGIKLILMRCAGYNNINLGVAKDLGFTIMRVPGYSPEAVAEHAMALALCANRHIHKGYIRVRENNFELDGLLGTNFHGKTAGIVSTGKIGAAMARICKGFGMHVLGFDPYPNPDLDFVEYVDLDELLERSDLISLHAPLFMSGPSKNYHMIDKDAIDKMKEGVVIVNTGRGGLIDTQALIDGIISRKIGAAGLDVYEEEGPNVYRNRSANIIDSVTARLCSFPNVVMTSHQAYFSREALSNIAEITLQNAQAFADGGELPQQNVVKID